MIDFQAHAIFPTHAVSSPGPLPRGSERLEINAGKDRLHGVHVPPSRRGAERVLILGFAGNAWNSEDAASYLHQLYPEADVVAFHYRGYRPSTGSPSAEALIADAPLVHDLAVERIKPDRTIAVGFSIGSGVAAELATRRKIDGLILVTPFDSLAAAAADLYPMLPVKMLFRHEMDSAAALRKIDTPVAIIGAAEDSLIRPARTAALRRAARNLAFERTIARAGHNDIYHLSQFHQAMDEALASLSAGRRA